MCMFSSPSMPAPPPPPPPPPDPPKVDEVATRVRDDSRKKARLFAGRNGDILAGGESLGDADTAKAELKSVLG